MSGRGKGSNLIKVALTAEESVATHKLAGELEIDWN